MIGFSFSSDHKTWFCDKFEAFFPLIWLLKIFFKIILNYLLQLEFERVTSVRTNYYCLEIWNIYYNTLFSKQMTGYCRVKILMFFFFFSKNIVYHRKADNASSPRYRFNAYVHWKNYRVLYRTFGDDGHQKMFFDTVNVKLCEIIMLVFVVVSIYMNIRVTKYIHKSE